MTRPYVTHLVPALFGPDGIMGGAERYALELARAMSLEVPVRLVTFGDRDSVTREGDLEIVVLGSPWYVRGQRTNPMSRRLFAALGRARIVHCHQQHILASSLTAAYCRATGRRVFVTDLGGGGWDISALWKTDRWYHGHLHLSEYSRKVAGHDGSPRAHVIGAGVDTVKFSPGTGPRTGGVLFVGRILPHKGINYLIEAMPADLALTIIGQVANERYLRDLHRLADEKQVTFRHDADDAALVSAYRAALCVVLASVYRTMYGQETAVPELLGQTLLEAMACGAPVLTTNVASLPEVVEDGVTGFLVAPNDAEGLRKKLEWLRQHAERAAEMGAAGRRRVEQHCAWQAVVSRCLTAYHG